MKVGILPYLFIGFLGVGIEHWSLNKVSYIIPKERWRCAHAQIPNPDNIMILDCDVFMKK